MNAYLRISIYYLLIGVLWIIITDYLAVRLASSAEALSSLQNLKGWLFVVVSSLLIYWLTRNAFRKEIHAEQEKRAIFKKAIEGSDHILLNYLNQMQLVILEAGNCKDFDPEIIELAQRISDEAVVELKNLERLHIDQSHDIDSYVYRRRTETGNSLENVAKIETPRQP